MVDGKDIAGAVAVIERNPDLGIGLHLDLCPVAGFYSLPYDEMRRRLDSPAMLQRVSTEVVRQIEAFRALGLEFTHMDGHRHFHALPELFHTVLDVALTFGLRTLRFTRDWILPRTPSVYLTTDFYEEATGVLKQNSVRYPDHFVYGWKPYNADSFREGLNELMVHVGYDDPHYLREHQQLASPEFWAHIKARDISLCSYCEPGPITLHHSAAS
jgi:predicted glycoside hydrolase/deacetylase ChbG (UPF0249 family)